MRDRSGYRVTRIARPEGHAIMKILVEYPAEELIMLFSSPIAHQISFLLYNKMLLILV
jgi:hypothetical protein